MKIVQSERTLITLLSLKLMLILNLKKLSYAFRLKYSNIYDFFGSGEKHTALATIVWPFPVRNGFKDVCSTFSPHNLAAESFNLSIASYLKQTTKIWAFIPSLAVSDKLFSASFNQQSCSANHVPKGNQTLCGCASRKSLAPTPFLEIGPVYCVILNRTSEVDSESEQ